MKSLNESITTTYINEILKKLDIIFCNIKDPDEAMEFIIDVVSGIQQGVIDKVKYMSSVNPNLEIWEELEKEIKKPTDEYITSIESVQFGKIRK